MTFEETVAQFTSVGISDVTQAIAIGKDMVVFLGRSTCPYCRLFAPKLAQVAKDNQKKVSFVNSENPLDAEALQAFRQEYHLATVPALLVIRSGQVRAVCDSSLTESEILAFLNADM
ncbi:thioredoxin family protein [Streptococcus canis]|uniref:thioredoxin family protein n=1 Tax=Streptococcus canis TaxID=1329 RepID=UPI00298D76FE|nr:thioredoxin family protein [Streptococcus canis]MDW7796297.1 thioredoxin family protein [Streptococcus canis]